MILRMSSLFVRTLREDPADAEVPSHRLLVRAGYIRRAAPGIYTWLPLGLRVLRKVEGIVREEMDAIGAQEVLLPRAAAPRALRGHRPLDRVRRQHLPPQGPQGRRLPARPDPRGDVHAPGEGPVLVLQGPAAVDLPDPDRSTATRRVRAPACCAAASSSMKDSYSFDVDDAGLEASYQNAPRRLRPDLRPPRLRLRRSSRPCPARWAARDSEEFLAKAAVGEDTYVRCTTCDYAANVEAVQVRARHPAAATTAPPAAHVEDTPDTPTIETLVDHLNDAPSPATTGPGPPPTPSRTCSSSCTHPDGTREPLAIGLPGDREVDPKRLEAPARADRGRGLRRGRLRQAPQPGQGLHRPRRAGGGACLRHPLPRRPPRRRRHRAG